MHNCTALKSMFIECYTTVLSYMVSFLLNYDSAGGHSFVFLSIQVKLEQWPLLRMTWVAVLSWCLLGLT